MEKGNVLRPSNAQMIVGPIFTFFILLTVFWVCSLVTYILPEGMSTSNIAFEYIGRFYFAGTVLFSIVCLIGSYLGYFFMTYELQEDQLRIKTGIIWKSDKAIPYQKLTDATLQQGPIDGLFGFASLSLQTAGSTEVEATMYGLTNFTEIQEEIRKKIQGIKDVVPSSEKDVAEGILVNKPDIMEEILKTLKSIDSKMK